VSINKAKKIVERYVQALEANAIPFSRVYLFGSYAYGKAREGSDIDVAVVVEKLNKGETKIEKQMSLWKIAPQIDLRIEPIVLEEQDFKKGESSIMAHQVEKYGVLVK